MLGHKRLSGRPSDFIPDNGPQGRPNADVDRIIDEVGRAIHHQPMHRFRLAASSTKKATAKTLHCRDCKCSLDKERFRASLCVTSVIAGQLSEFNWLAGLTSYNPKHCWKQRIPSIILSEKNGPSSDCQQPIEMSPWDKKGTFYFFRDQGRIEEDASHCFVALQWGRKRSRGTEKGVGSQIG